MTSYSFYLIVAFDKNLQPGWNPKEFAVMFKNRKEK